MLHVIRVSVYLNRFCIYWSVSCSSACYIMCAVSLAYLSLHSQHVCAGLCASRAGGVAILRQRLRKVGHRPFTQHRQTGPNEHTADLHSTRVSSKWAVSDMHTSVRTCRPSTHALFPSSDGAVQQSERRHTVRCLVACVWYSTVQMLCIVQAGENIVVKLGHHWNILNIQLLDVNVSIWGLGWWFAFK